MRFILFIVFVMGFVFNISAESIHYSFKESMKIDDSKEDFFFKYPDPFYRSISTDSRGNVYLLDDNRILKFDSKGIYSMSLCPKGLGPGEVTSISGYLIRGDEVIIYNRRPSKIIIRNINGAIVDEFRFEEDMGELFGCIGDRYYFFREEFLTVKPGSSVTTDVNLELLEGFKIKNDGKYRLLSEFKFKIKKFFASAGSDASGVIGLVSILHSSVKNGSFVLSNSESYRLRRVNLKDKTVEPLGSRKYNRVKMPEDIAKQLGKRKLMLYDKVFSRPVQQYLNDVRDIVNYKDSIWVFTSTVDKKRGILVDEYSGNHVFKGSFYMKLSDRIEKNDYLDLMVTVDGDNLYTVEFDSEDNPYIVKYRIKKN